MNRIWFSLEANPDVPSLTRASARSQSRQEPVTREILILETHIQRVLGDRPAMIFFPGSELGGDPSNWWGPNRACVVELLKVLGFRRVDMAPGSHPDREVFHAWTD